MLPHILVSHLFSILYKNTSKASYSTHFPNWATYFTVFLQRGDYVGMGLDRISAGNENAPLWQELENNARDIRQKEFLRSSLFGSVCNVYQGIINWWKLCLHSSTKESTHISQTKTTYTPSLLFFLSVVGCLLAECGCVEAEWRSTPAPG